MQQCDVLIVGGGPAGSTLALTLGKSGFSTIIMDRQQFPRDKVCAGWVTPPILQSLHIDPDDYRKGRVLQPILGFRLGLIGGDEVAGTYLRNVPVSYGIRRCEFDHYLLEHSGARVMLGQACNSIRRSGPAWIVNDAVTAPVLAGAGGHYCPVARYLGGHARTSTPVVVAQEIEFKMSPAQRRECEVEPELPELYFCKDFKGYGWVFRKGDYLNIGLGREDRENLTAQVRDFCQYLRGLKKIPRDLPGRFHGHAYLLYEHSTRPVSGEGVVLVGDAAGLAFRCSGEGIRPAIESGILAGEIIHKARGDYSEAKLRGYRRALINRFGQRTPVLQQVLRVIPDQLRCMLARKLMAMPWFANRVVIDDWFLHRHQLPLPLT